MLASCFGVVVDFGVGCAGALIVGEVDAIVGEEELENVVAFADFVA